MQQVPTQSDDIANTYVVDRLSVFGTLAQRKHKYPYVCKYHSRRMNNAQNSTSSFERLDQPRLLRAQSLKVARARNPPRDAARARISTIIWHCKSERQDVKTSAYAAARRSHKHALLQTSISARHCVDAPLLEQQDGSLASLAEAAKNTCWRHHFRTNYLGVPVNQEVNRIILHCDKAVAQCTRHVMSTHMNHDATMDY